MATLHTLPWLKFPHHDYLFSEFRAAASALAKAAYFELLCFAMKQTPALSIPNNDTILSRWIGISPRQWQKIRALVLAQFSYSAEDDRYYSPLLARLYTDTEPTQPHARPTPMTGAERTRKHRARQALAPDTATPATPDSRTPCNDVTPPVTPTETAGNAPDVTAAIETERETQTETEAEQPPATAAPARYRLSFDFQPEASTLRVLLDKLDVNPDKHTPQTLNRFIAYYQAKGLAHSRAEWEWLYVKWLGRERGSGEGAASAPSTSETRTQTPVRLADERPQWMIFAERKAARQAVAGSPP